MLLHGMILGLGLAWLGILLGAGLSWQLFRQNGRFLLRLEELEKRLNELEFGEEQAHAGLPIGSEAPGFELPDLANGRKSLAQYRGQSLLLLFFNPACGFCRELAPKLQAKVETRKQKAEMGSNGTWSEEPMVLIVSTGGAEANRQLFDEHRLICPVLLEMDSEVATAYQVNGTPGGYVIDREGKIASELAMGAEALLALTVGKAERRNQKNEIGQGLGGPVAGNGDGRTERFKERSLARSKIKRDGLKAGTPAPDFRLPRLDGRGDLGLEDLRGRLVFLVFSSPHCGPCNTLAPHLEKLHREHPDLELVMISKGEPKENRAKVKEHGLTFPVVLQRQWEISRRYAMFATPIAYLIDEAGVITQDVAVGTEAILDLLRRAEPWYEHPQGVALV